MSGDAFDRVRDRIELGRAARVSTPGSSGPGKPAATSRVSFPPRIGDRVFDVLRGQDGVIVAPPAGQLPPAGNVYVRTDQGVTCARPVADLLVRPTPPAARS